MKRWIVAMLMVAVACSLSACKKEESPKSYDPKTDAPASTIQIPMDNSFGADQTAISSRTANRAAAATSAPAEKPASAPATAAASGDKAASADTIAEVKQTITKLKAAAKANPKVIPYDFFDPSTSSLLQKINSDTKDLVAKVAKLNDAAKAKSIPLPQDIQTVLTVKDMTEGMAASFATIDADKMKFTETPAGIIAKDAEDETLFVRQSGTWKMALPPQGVDAFTALDELLVGQAKFAEAMTQGISGGSITKANLDEKAKALTAQFLQAPLKKVQGIRDQVKGK